MIDIFSGPAPLPLNGLAEANGITMTLIIVIRPEAFYVFKDEEYICSYAHRRDLSSISQLTVGVPPFDDNGHPEDITVKKVRHSILSICSLCYTVR